MNPLCLAMADLVAATSPFCFRRVACEQHRSCHHQNCKSTHLRIPLRKRTSPRRQSYMFAVSSKDRKPYPVLPLFLKSLRTLYFPTGICQTGCLSFQLVSTVLVDKSRALSVPLCHILSEKRKWEIQGSERCRIRKSYACCLVSAGNE